VWDSAVPMHPVPLPRRPAACCCGCHGPHESKAQTDSPGAAGNAKKSKLKKAKDSKGARRAATAGKVPAPRLPGAPPTNTLPPPGFPPSTIACTGWRWPSRRLRLAAWRRREDATQVQAQAWVRAQGSLRHAHAPRRHGRARPAARCRWESSPSFERAPSTATLHRSCDRAASICSASRPASRCLRRPARRHAALRPRCRCRCRCRCLRPPSPPDQRSLKQQRQCSQPQPPAAPGPTRPVGPLQQQRRALPVALWEWLSKTCPTGAGPSTAKVERARLLCHSTRSASATACRAAGALCPSSLVLE